MKFILETQDYQGRWYRCAIYRSASEAQKEKLICLRDGIPARIITEE